MIVKFNYFNHQTNEYVTFDKLQKLLSNSDNISLNIDSKTGELFILDNGVKCLPLLYSGINDNEGQPVFEGDILEVPGCMDPMFHSEVPSTKEPVRFGKTCFFLGEYPMEEDSVWLSTFAKKIGNVFQNPNLLDIIEIKEDVVEETN